MSLTLPTLSIGIDERLSHSLFRILVSKFCIPDSRFHISKIDILSSPVTIVSAVYKVYCIQDPFHFPPIPWALLPRVEDNRILTQIALVCV